MRERILIVAKPGRLRDALRALMATIPQLEITGQVEDSAVALKMVTERLILVVCCTAFFATLALSPMT